MYFFVLLVEDLFECVVDRYNILLEEGRTLQLYEREMSVTHAEIFFRRLERYESPLGRISLKIICNNKLRPKT